MRPRASQVVMIMLVGTATLATGQAVNAPGQGSFELDVETVEAEGKGCGMDYLDIQVFVSCWQPRVCTPNWD